MHKTILTLAIQTILLGSLPAMAQQQEETQSAPQVGDAERISVTGSRIKRDSFSFATPIVSLDQDAIMDTGLGELS